MNADRAAIGRTKQARTRETLANTRIDAQVRFTDRLYDATPGIVIEEINTVSDAVATLLVVGHEPTMSALALGLAGDDDTDVAVAERISAKFPIHRWRIPWHEVEY